MAVRAERAIYKSLQEVCFLDILATVDKRRSGRHVVVVDVEFTIRMPLPCDKNQAEAEAIAFSQFAFCSAVRGIVLGPVLAREVVVQHDRS